MNEMETPFVTEIIVRYAETDGMGIVHHGVHPIWMEHIRCEWLAAQKWPYDRLEKEGWHIPVIALNLEYRSVLVFGKKVEVHLWPRLESALKFHFDYEIWQENRLCAKASTSHVMMRDGRGVRMPAFMKELF